MPGRARTDESGIIPNQVFIGCPWKTARPKYERLMNDLKKKYPLSFVIVGRGEDQKAEDLLDHIRERLLSSSFAIFDATGGNANVSLEFGIAETADIPRALYLSVHAASRKSSKDSPIIADLAGKRREHYTQERQLGRLLTTFTKSHNYTKRFESFLKRDFGGDSSGLKKRVRALALKVVHALDGKESVRRADVVGALLVDPGHYLREGIEDIIRRLHRAELIRSVQGRYSTVTIR